MLGAAASALALVLSGCGVATRVSLTVDSSGHGTVAVTVTLDPAAVDAVGGLARLRSEMAVGDLKAAGWSVTGPAPQGGGAGGAVVSVSHGFSGLAQAQRLMAEVAGPGVFDVQLTSHHSFWHTTFHLNGAVDLTCGVNCFGDAGLRSATGSPVGFDPGPLSAQSGQTAGEVFTFQFDGRLPGRVSPGPGGTLRPGGTVSWAPVLGQKVVLSASSQSVNRSAIEEVGAAIAAVLLALTAFILWRIGRWLRNRFWPRHSPQHRKQPKGAKGESEPAPGPAPAAASAPAPEDSGGSAETVTPPS